MGYLVVEIQFPSTYDHRSEKAAGPVRSPVHKLRTGRLVIEWVTIGESLLLYVYFFALASYVILAPLSAKRSQLDTLCTVYQLSHTIIACFIAVIHDLVVL